MAEQHQVGRRRAGVLGSPVAHSLSPALHRAAYAQLGLDWAYDAYEVDEQDLSRFLATLDDSWAGLSLTMPLKERVIDLLADVDPTARLIRSVNTVLPAPEGWRGANTDVYGMVRALREAGLAGPVPSGTVLGSGATARSAVAALAELGAREIVVCARRAEAAEQVAQLARRLGLAAVATGLTPDLIALESSVVVSTLPGAVAAPWADLAHHARGALLDVSYHPWPSALSGAWGGAVVASGRDLLLWQAVEQVRLMTGRAPDPTAMAAVLD